MALKVAKTPWSFGHFECNTVKENFLSSYDKDDITFLKKIYFLPILFLSDSCLSPPLKWLRPAPVWHLLVSVLVLYAVSPFQLAVTKTLIYEPQ